MGWVDIKREISWLGRSPPYFVHSNSRKELANRLSELGFDIFTIDGKKIRSVNEFFSEASKVFGFPDYFGKNWDAYYDCWRDFDVQSETSVALLWDNPDYSVKKNNCDFVKCAFELLSISDAYKKETNTYRMQQFEVFFLGAENGYIPHRYK